MNGELDIRMDKKELWGIRILTMVIVIISIVVDKPDPGDKVFAWIVGGGFSLFWLVYEIDCFFWRLHLTADECLFVNMVGMKRKFWLDDVECIHPSKLGYVIRDRYGKRITEVARTGMVNGDKLADFFEDMQARGLWHGRIVRGYEIPHKSIVPAKDAPVPDELVVKPDASVFAETAIFALVTPVTPIGLVIYEGVCALTGRQGSGAFVVILGTLCGLFGCAMLCWNLRNDLKLYRSRRLVLTSGECSMADEKGASYSFRLDDVEDVYDAIEEYRHRGKSHIGRFVYIAFRDGAKQKLEYGYEKRAFPKIKAFVAHHRKEPDKL